MPATKIAIKTKKATKRVKLTRTDRLAATLSSTGSEYLLTVRVKGEHLGTVTAIADSDWTGPGDLATCRYAVLDDCGEMFDCSDDLADIRETLAQTIREMRADRLQEIADEAAAEIEEAAERDAEAARDAVEGLIGSGKAADVVKALKAAGLI
jgi:hypothetical protein